MICIFSVGQPVIGPDGNPIYYQAGYQQPAAGNVAFVANSNNAAYVSQQGQYIPYYYVSAAGQQSTTGNPPQGSAQQQYYIMQPAAQSSGHYVYMPAQVSKKLIFYLTIENILVGGPRTG